MKAPPPSSQTGRDFGPAPEIGLATACLKNIVRFVFPFASPVLFRGTAGGENEKQMGQAVEKVMGKPRPLHTEGARTAKFRFTPFDQIADTRSNSLSSICGSSVSSGIRQLRPGIVQSDGVQNRGGD